MKNATVLTIPSRIVQGYSTVVLEVHSNFVDMRSVYKIEWKSNISVLLVMHYRLLAESYFCKTRGHVSKRDQSQTNVSVCRESSILNFYFHLGSFPFDRLTSFKYVCGLHSQETPNTKLSKRIAVHRLRSPFTNCAYVRRKCSLCGRAFPEWRQ